MSMINRAFILCCFVVLISPLTGCSKAEKRQNDIEYLLPDLRDQPIHSFTLTSNEGETRLVKRENNWWITPPVDYLAEQETVESILRKLIDAEIGKEVTVAPQDMAQLNLTPELGLNITLTYGKNQKQAFIIGAINMLDKGDALDMLGAGHSSRRYVRMLGEQDKVYLTSLSFFDLSSAATFWTDFSMVRIPSFKRLTIKQADTIITSYYRTKPFGDLYQEDANGTVTQPAAGILRCFEDFLKSGYCYEVADAKLQLNKRTTQDHAKHIVIEDFLGMTYHFQLGQEKAPSQSEETRAALSAGMLNDGIAETRLPFILTTSSANKPLNVFEQKLHNHNQKIANRLSNRVAFIDMENASCLLRLLEVAQ